MKWFATALILGATSLIAHIVLAAILIPSFPSEPVKISKSDILYLSGEVFEAFATASEEISAAEEGLRSEALTEEPLSEEPLSEAASQDNESAILVEAPLEQAELSEEIIEEELQSTSLQESVAPPSRPAQKKRVEQPKAKTVNKEAPKKAQTKPKKSTAKSTPSSKTKPQKPSSGVTRSAAKPQKKAPLSKAAHNYPSLVQKKIARTRQRKSGAPGRVVVSFSIGNTGALTALSVAKSSGNGSTDQAALMHIKRSAPFPKPPSGAQQKFTIPITVK